MLPMSRGLSKHPIILSALPHQGLCSSQKPPSSPTDAGGYGHVPGIYTDAQIEGWKKITDAVHAKGSYIFMQLWALGRAADIDFLEAQNPPSPYVSASSVTLTGKSKPPRPLTESEIKDYIAAYAKAASNAVHGAGFDGYRTNARIGGVGTKKAARDLPGRLSMPVVNAVGEDRVGIRISPWSPFQDMKMPDPRPTFAYLATALRDKHPKLAYLHVTEARVGGNMDIASNPDENNDFLRQIWNEGEGGEERIFISAGWIYPRDSIAHCGGQGRACCLRAAVYTKLDYKPDLPVRLQKNLPLTPGDRSKYYLVGDLTPLGYNDWSFADGSIEGMDGRL
ncbi:hypothetical protein J3R83DRAFT_3295 [Lanmaoa asiatica]|nr:hypothetical protein J3R83DRAFT_3295 [Lanmaoa asiatica]